MITLYYLNNMKHILIILLFISTGLLAQNDRNDRIKALKTAFITERLDLSSAEAEKFWPKFNAYEKKMEALRKNERQEILIKFSGGMDAMTEAEASSLTDKSIAFREKEIGNRKQLIQDLRSVISAKKIIRLIKTEDDFKRKLLERMKQRKNRP